MEHQKLIDTIMEQDKNIRFATVCNMAGDMEVTKQREGVENFFTTEETHQSLKDAAKAWIHSRTPHFKKVGEGLYTLSAYEKLKRATIPLEDGFLLLATMDNTADHTKTIADIIKQVHAANT
ncbi:MAG: hypothetical protein ACE5EJ_03085 [Nitrosopumilaceae archaeon]